MKEIKAEDANLDKEVKEKTSDNAASTDGQHVVKMRKKLRSKKKKKVTDVKEVTAVTNVTDAKEITAVTDVTDVTNGATQETKQIKKKRKKGKKRKRTNSAGDPIDGMQSAEAQADIPKVGTDTQVNPQKAKGKKKKLKKSNDDKNTTDLVKAKGEEKIKQVNGEDIPMEAKGKKELEKVNDEAMPVKAKKKKKNRRKAKKAIQMDVKMAEQDEDDKASSKEKKINADRGTVDNPTDVPAASSEKQKEESKNKETKKNARRNSRKREQRKKKRQNKINSNNTEADGVQDLKVAEDDEPPVKKAKVVTSEPESPQPQKPKGEIGTPAKKKKKNKNKPINRAVSLNTAYSNLSNKNEIKKHWTEDGLPLKKDSGLEIIKKPFTCGYLPNFLENADLLKGIEEELKDIPPLKKNNDLYKFTQTPDLKATDKPHISSLRDFLYGDFRKWLTEVTGIPLNETVDMGSSTYQYTDVLLCHDDELEGRRIAYILYLVPPWEASDGGTLDLFDTDKNGQPKNIVRSLIPQWNAFAFFEVSPVSFHQVAEVLSKDKTRLSINGWFHGPPIDGPPKYDVPQRPFLHPKHVEEDVLYSWINPAYLEEKTQKTIRKKFRTDSEIELESFLTEEKYEELSAALMAQGLKWKSTGPANKNSYQTLLTNKHPDVLKECLSVLQSEAMFLILSQLTGLSLHKLAPPDSEPDSDEDDEKKEPNPRLRARVGRWGHGSYTLIRDSDAEEQESALDATLFLQVSDNWREDLGGYNSYISKDEDAELLSVLPRSNCFALVYRDAETLKFTKHINAGVLELKEEERHYIDINCKYYE